MKQKLEKWQRDIVRIREQVIHLANYRRWNRVYETVVNANPRLRPGMHLLDYFRNVYGDFAAMAVRRQAKTHKDSISLRGLLEDLEKNNALVTRSWTQAEYRRPHANGTTYDDEMADRLANAFFDKFADDAGECLRKELITADLARLASSTERIVTITDKSIAHDDRVRTTETVTFDDLNGAVDVLEDLTKRYVVLLTGESLLSVVPYDTADSTAVFNFAWIDPANKPDFGGTNV